MNLQIKDTGALHGTSQMPCFILVTWLIKICTWARIAKQDRYDREEFDGQSQQLENLGQFDAGMPLSCRLWLFDVQFGMPYW
jgi:hypothetical protein